MEIKDIVHKSPSKNPLYIEFTACLCELMPEGALTLFTACDAYRLHTLQDGHC